MPAPITRTKGTLLKIGDGAAPQAFLTVGRVFSIGEVKKTRETIDVTTHDSPGDFREFIGGIRDGGTIAIQYRFAPTDAGQAALEAAAEDGEVHSFQIVFPAAIGKRWDVSAVVTESGTSEAPVEGVLNGMATIKVSGVPLLVTPA